MTLPSERSSTFFLKCHRQRILKKDSRKEDVATENEEITTDSRNATETMVKNDGIEA